MIRIHKSGNYNWVFDTETGYFMRWGKNHQDNPEYSEVGPEILDIEVSTVCHQNCNFCYKNNLSVGKNMSFETFKIIFDKIKGNLTQVAFGIGDIDANKDLRKMMKYCRDNYVIPNITINGYNLTDDWVNYLSSMCGAVSVSNYGKNVCYSAVEKLTNAGLKQVNIHQLLSEETLPQVYSLLEDSKKDTRLKKLNAIVFLSLKQRGRGVKYHTVSVPDFELLVETLFHDRIKFGFDSCTANKFLNYINKHPEHKPLEQYVEPCESGLFSSYINVEGIFYPCSFTENSVGLDVVNCNDFVKDIWYNAAVILWRNLLLTCHRNCPVYNI